MFQDDAGTFFQIGRELLTNLQHWSCQFYHLKLVMESVKLLIDSKINFGLSVLRWLNGLNKTLIIFFLILGPKLWRKWRKTYQFGCNLFLGLGSGFVCPSLSSQKCLRIFPCKSISYASMSFCVPSLVTRAHKLLFLKKYFFVNGAKIDHFVKQILISSQLPSSHLRKKLQTFDCTFWWFLMSSYKRFESFLLLWKC